MVDSDCPTPPARPIQISIKCVEPNGNLHRSLSLISMNTSYISIQVTFIGLCLGVWQFKKAIKEKVHWFSLTTSEKLRKKPVVIGRCSL